jgi:cation diffusion facilitator CzcD-associated flavoprotein CzcO
MTAKRFNACEVAVIGAGPYGLSVAAHLAAAGVSTRVFGVPMAFWRNHMPKGMRLRSPWGATDLSDPAGTLSLDTFAERHSADRDKPLALENFVAYGEWFQTNALPDIDRRQVRLVEATGNGFQIELADGEVFAARRVVIATGLANQDYRPGEFRDLPASLVSHACEHIDFAPMQGKRVAVIGRGQSACESAVLLAEAGADAELISRGEVHWLGAAEAKPMTARARFREALAAPSAIGPFPLSWLVEVPGVVRHMPPALREKFGARCLRAAASGWLKPRFERVKCDFGRTIKGARAEAGRIVLDLDTGPRRFDHVVLGTGYRIDISRIGILSPRLLDKIARAGGSPLLRAGFESSVPRLHFVGSYAVASFGPLLRFVAGTAYAARAVTRAAQDRGAKHAVAEFSAPPR